MQDANPSIAPGNALLAGGLFFSQHEDYLQSPKESIWLRIANAV
jgi:hypothetical protein